MLNELELRLIDTFQHGMPVCAAPYQAMAEQLGCTEDELLDSLRDLTRRNVLSRIGPVFEHSLAGASTLAAMSVPEHRLQSVADLVSALPEVNHNYQREHAWNLWFVLTAANRTLLDAVLASIERQTGLDVLDLPMEASYCIDLGFPVGKNHRMPT